MYAGNRWSFHLYLQIEWSTYYVSIIGFMHSFLIQVVWGWLDQHYMVPVFVMAV